MQDGSRPGRWGDPPVGATGSDAVGTHAATSDIRRIKAMTFAMFLMFAMSTDAVGVIIPQVIQEFGLGMTAGGAFHYATMAGISISAILLGFLADRLGRRPVIVVGLSLFAAAAFLFSVGQSFGFFVLLLFVSGLGIGIFKTGALALVGDISTSTRSHTATMNLVEGFFGIGAIIGPALVAALLSAGMSWKWLYVIVGALSVVLIGGILSVRPPASVPRQQSAGAGSVLKAIKDPYVLGFSTAIAFYVAAETAIYVWMPTYLKGYAGVGASLVPYALATFFVLRVVGRFLGFWLLARFSWTAVLAICCLAVAACFAAALAGGQAAAAVALPASGLFMSVIYPTLNSKGISCTPKVEHGAVAGVVLFFTCVAAVVAPLSMGLVSDALGDPVYGFVLAGTCSAILALLSLFNWLAQPARHRLEACEENDYHEALPAGGVPQT